jgi:hypothetical protein
MHIAAANSARAHGHEDIVRSNRRLLDIRQLQLSVLSKQ